MRFAALAVVVLMGTACKDSPSEQKATTGSGAAVSAPERPALARPDVTSPGPVKVGKLAATVTYSERALEVDGTQLGKLRNGVIDRELLDRVTGLLETAGASGDPIGISLDPALPYVRVSELLYNLKAAGFRNLALLAGAGATAVPLDLMDSDQLGSAGLRPVVTLTPRSIVLWSASGEEGTQQKPKVVLPSGAYSALAKELGGIVTTRWPDGMRTPEDRIIIIQPGRAERAETLLQTLAAVRADGKLELFPTIYLTAGT